jgi:hypothetical protein
MKEDGNGEREKHGRSVKRPVPREHGALGLVLQPFIAAALLAWRWDILLMPAFSLVLLGFLVREPLTILARQRKAGHTWNTQCRTASRWLAVEVASLVLCFAVLAGTLPWFALSLLAGLGFALTIVSVWFAAKNSQRSIALQITAVAGLTSSAFVAALAAERMISTWVWLLWAILTLHGIVSVLCVHARLEMRIAATHSSGTNSRRVAAYGTALQFFIAFPAALFLGIPVAIPILFSSAIHATDLRHLSSPANLRERLQRVGFRLLGLSLLHMALTVAALWSFVHH